MVWGSHFSSYSSTDWCCAILDLGISIYSMASSRDEASRRRRVTFQQLESLWEFLNSHRDLAVGYNKSAQAREYSKRMWMSVSETLNSQGEGATKDWKGWSNYWVDYKAKLKRRVAALRISQTRTGGGPSEVLPLNDLEKKFLSLLGEGFGTGLPNTQVDPFPTLSQSTHSVSEEPETAPSQGIPVQAHSDLHLLVDEGPQPQDPPVTGEMAMQQEETPSPQRMEVPEEPRVTRNVRHRRSTRQGALSQQAARRILVDVAQARLLLEQQNCQTLQHIAESQQRNSEVWQEILSTLNRITAAVDKPTGSGGPETRNEGAPDC